MPPSYLLTKRVRHGFARTGAVHPVYFRWTGMRQRCLNPRNREYPDYGGRGITICDRWRDSFLNFYADVGDCPEGCSLDRIDNARGYEPGNVRWATLTTQNRNTRTVKLTDEQVTEMHRLHASGWQKKPLARHFSIAPKTVRQILSGARWKDQYATRAAPLTEAARMHVPSRNETA